MTQGRIRPRYVNVTFCDTCPIPPVLDPANAEVALRFWSRVAIKEPNDCWDWTGSRIPRGYGQFMWAAKYGRTKPLGTHRVAWELTKGEIPAGLHVCHTCDRRCCTNPAHLFLGTHTDNMRDAARKGRLSVERPTKHKVTDAQALDILARVRAGELQYKLAEEYGVTKGHICQICAGRGRFAKLHRARKAVA